MLVYQYNKVIPQPDTISVLQKGLSAVDYDIAFRVSDHVGTVTFGGSVCVTVFFRRVWAFFPERTDCKSSNPYPSPRLSMRAAFSQPESFSRYDFPRFETSQPYSCNSFSSSSKSAGLCDNALSIATRSSSR